MPKKTTDPFMGGLWNALIADDLGPGGNRTAWAETPVRIRNRFCTAVRQILQSGAAFEASALGLGSLDKVAVRAGKKPTGKRPDPRELQLPLMASVEAKKNSSR